MKQDTFMLLDGATGSNLMAAGMPAGSCTEQWVLENPEVLTQLQTAFVNAGSQIVLAPTFGANAAKLASYGLAEQTGALNKALFALSRKAAGSAAVVAGDVSPSGLFLEPFGTASFADICAVYDEQMAALQEAGAQIVMIETQMTLSDARAALLCAKARGLTAFVTITVEAGGRTLSGLSLPSAVVTLQAMGADGIGLNCSCGPKSMVPLLKAAVPYAKVPFIAKPNAGEPGNPLPPAAFAAAVEELVDCGASILGGCCGTTPEHIAALSAIISKKAIPHLPENNTEYLADERAVYACPQPAASETYACGPDLADDLLEADEKTNLLLLTLTAPEDAAWLQDALPLCRLPVCFVSDHTPALEAALQLYQGRAMIAGKGVTNALITKYGALPYQQPSEK